MKLDNLNRIAVIGCPGSGKTTFSVALNKILKLSLYHLDLIYWNKNWERMPTDVWIKKIQEIAVFSNWIIDGNYIETLEIRVKEADFIIFFDYKTYKCLWNSVKRLFHWNKKIDKIYDRNVTLVRPSIKQQTKLMNLILKFNKHQRHQIYEIIIKHNKQFIIFNNKNEAEKFLSKIDLSDDN
ncbi:MAG TPA: hypothetical protein VJN02_10925 [Gammaproteobacteria bacterium]|nr:hypothetical protein [Gammaproteobacteria bacterium]